MKKRVRQIIIVSFLIVILCVSFCIYWFNREIEVVIVNSDNSIVDRKTIKYGESLDDLKVPVVPEGYKFNSLDKSTKKIKKDTVIKVNVEEIDNGENIISLGNSYGAYDSLVSIPLIIDGEVNICAIDLSISYDSSYLTFVESKNEDNAVVANEKDGNIYVSLASTNNIDSTIYMCDLVFKINNEIDESTPLHINVKKCGKYEDDKIVEIKYSTIDGIISNIS